MKSLLEAVSPTSAALLGAELFSIGYAWYDQVLGELQGHTVLLGVDYEAAVGNFKSRHPHVTRVWRVA